MVMYSLTGTGLALLGAVLGEYAEPAETKA
jgi:hypothetical protein